MDDKTMNKIMKTAIGLFEEGYRESLIAEAVTKLYPGVRTTPIATAGIEMYVSLRKAIDDVGGTGWDVDDLCKMTVMDLISNLATNNVRFIFKKKKK